MKALKILKWVGLTIVGLAGLTVAYIYFQSNKVFNSQIDVPLKEVIIPTDTASIAEGFRQTRLAHCNGCHGENFEGQVVFEDDKFGRMVAPNVTKRVKEYSDAELYRVIRHGIKKDGTLAFGMPSEMFYHLKEESVLNIIAYLRSLEEQESDIPESEYKFMVHMMLGLKMYEPPPHTMNHEAPRYLARFIEDEISHGNYLTRTACSHCHGIKLEGSEMMGSPALSIISNYSREQFHHFFRTGEPVGKPDAGEMTKMAQKCFKYFTDEEVDAIYSFLQTAMLGNDIVENSGTH